jgi:lipopolysaccharide export system protein LptA
MKGLMAGAVTLAVVLCLGSSSPSLHAQDSPSTAPTQDSGQTQEMQTFTGTVVKNGDSFTLKDEVNNATYGLDDQERAKPHEGKQVRVKGTLDSATNTIRISELEPSA